MANKSELLEEAKKLGIEGADDMTKDQLEEAIEDAQDSDDAPTPPGPDGEKSDKEDATPQTRAQQKAAELAAGPKAKPKAKLVKPPITDLYPWAVNRVKAEAAHVAVYQEMEMKGEQTEDENGTKYVGPEEAAQRVMDHYTAHNGLVRGQEKATIVGRRGRMKEGFEPGKTTTEVLGHDVDDDLE